MNRRVGMAVLGAAAGALVWSGCGRSGVTFGTADDRSIGPSDAVFTIGVGTFTPALVTVPPGARITFLNRDTGPHQVVSDRDAAGVPNCPDLDGPPIAPGGRFTFIMGSRPEICGFHDLLPGGAPVQNGAEPSLARALVQGTVIVANAAGASGSTGSSGSTGTSGTTGSSGSTSGSTGTTATTGIPGL